MHMPAEQLHHAYEVLRAQATEGAGSGGSPARGLALLLRSGLAGWMQAWVHLVGSPAQVPQPRRPEPRTPFELSAELAIILTQMALGGQAGNLIRGSST